MKAWILLLVSITWAWAGMEQPTEETLYRHATTLYSQEKFAESKQEVEKLLRMKPDHLGGKALKAHLPQVEKIADQAQRLTKMTEFLSHVADLEMSAFETKAKALDAALKRSRSMASISDPTPELKKKFEKNKAALAEDISWPEMQFENAYLNSRDTSDWKTAELTLKQRIEKFPDSPLARKAYATYLIERGHELEANLLVREALKKFPAYPDLQILEDHLKEILASKSDEARFTAHSKLRASLKAITQLRLDALKQTP